MVENETFDGGATGHVAGVGRMKRLGPQGFVQSGDDEVPLNLGNEPVTLQQRVDKEAEEAKRILTAQYRKAYLTDLLAFALMLTGVLVVGVAGWIALGLWAFLITLGVSLIFTGVVVSRANNRSEPRTDE